MVDITKADWKLFREKLPLWQERYMERLCKEYVELLSGDKDASERFWELEERIKKDRRRPGVNLSIDKSEMLWDLMLLIREDVITFEDLTDFSEELQEDIKGRIL